MAAMSNLTERERWMSQPVTDAQYVYLTTHLTMSELMSATERLCGLVGVTWPSQLTRGQAAEVISWWEEACK